MFGFNGVSTINGKLSYAFAVIIIVESSVPLLRAYLPDTVL